MPVNGIRVEQLLSHKADLERSIGIDEAAHPPDTSYAAHRLRAARTELGLVIERLAEIEIEIEREHAGVRRARG